MNAAALHTGLIETLSLSLVITSVAAVEMRRLVGRDRLRHQGHPHSLVPFPFDPPCG